MDLSIAEFDVAWLLRCPLSTAGVVDQPVSLVDVAPTIADILGFGRYTDFDGISLLSPSLKQQIGRPIFMETGVQMKLPEVGASLRDVSESAQDKMQYYMIEEDGKLVIGDEYYEQQLEEKQFGVITGNWLMIAEKSPKNRQEQYLIVDRNTGEWTTDLGDQSLPIGLVSKMMKSLNAFRNRSSVVASAVQ